jgi:hypothetical protein
MSSEIRENLFFSYLTSNLMPGDYLSLLKKSEKRDIQLDEMKMNRTPSIRVSSALANMNTSN